MIYGTLHPPVCYSFPRFKSAVLTDKRVRIMNEIITGIRVIKMYAWENAFKRVVTNLRRSALYKDQSLICTFIYPPFFPILSQERVKRHLKGGHCESHKPRVYDNLTHTYQLFSFLGLHWDWRYTNTQEGLHHFIFAHSTTTDFCALHNSRCSCRI